MKKHEIKTYEELVRRSTKDTEWFWEAVAEDLKIEWFKPYAEVLETAQGIPWAKWFLDGKINIAHNCLDKHARSSRKDKTAVLWEGEEGKERSLTYHELYR